MGPILSHVGPQILARVIWTPGSRKVTSYKCLAETCQSRKKDTSLQEPTGEVASRKEMPASARATVDSSSFYKSFSAEALDY